MSQDRGERVKRGAHAAGRVRMKVEPSPGTDSALVWPPWRRVRSRFCPGLKVVEELDDVGDIDPAITVRIVQFSTDTEDASTAYAPSFRV